MATTAKQNVSVAPVKDRSIVDIVSDRIHIFLQSGELHLPKNYSVENALKSAYLVLQAVEDKDHRKALEVCDKASIANALLDMIVQGLNPGKKQVYFIVYGKTLTAQRSYFGSMAVAEMVNPMIKDWGYDVVYEGDTFKYGIHNGKKSVVEHVQDLSNIDKAKIVAAYAMALDKDGNPIKTEIATIEEIHQAWKQSKMQPIDEKGEVKPSSVHGKFTRDMALKTVINKVAKFIINASSDNALLLDRINRNDDLADAAAVHAEIEDKANTGSVIMIAEEARKASEDGGNGKEVKPDTETPAGIPTLEEEAAELKKRGMVGGQAQTKGPGF